MGPLFSYADTSPKVWNLCEANSFFVGREDQLQKLASFFKPGTKKIAAITGGPGFGKTQIAKQFAQRFRATYDIIWWFDANQDILDQFEKLAMGLNRVLLKEDKIIPSTLSKDALVETIKDMLRTKNIKWLLIFDNTESYAHVEKFIPVTHYQPNKHILLTSRNATLWPDKVDIGKFKRSESMQLVKQVLPQETDANIEKLAKTLSDYPLGLAIATAFIKTHSPTTIPKYLSLYLTRTIKKKDPFIKTTDPLLEGYANDAQTPLSISLRFIEQQSLEALNTLRFMSLLNSKDIPESYIDLWLEKTKAKLSPAEVIKIMNDQSLIDIRTIHKQNDSEPIHFFLLHDLIHQLIQESIPMEDKRKLIDSATEIMLEVFAAPSEVFTTKIAHEPIHLLHAQKLCKRAKEIGYSSSKLSQLKVCMFQCYMSGTRDFEAAERIKEEIEIDLKAGIMPPSYYEALFKYNKGFLEAISAHYDEALQHMKEGLALFESSEKYPGEHKNEVLCALTNLMQYYAMRGETEKAEALLPKGEEMFRNSQSLVSNCAFIYASALVLIDQGKFQEAEKVLNKAKDYPTLSVERPLIYHGILLQKATALIKQTKFLEALKVIEECKKKTKEFFQGRNNMALSHILLLKSLVSIGKNKASSSTLQDLEKSLLVYNDFFKGEKKHRTQARVYFAMGKAHILQKDLKEALRHYLTSDEIYSNVLKDKRVDDVSELYRALSRLGALMKKDDVTSKYLNAHIGTFELTDPRTEEIIKVLDEKGLEVPL